MQYNFHIEKYKTGDVGGIRREQLRQYVDNSKYKNYVDISRSGENLYKGMKEDGSGLDWSAEIKAAKDRTMNSTGRAVRKDAVVLCSAVESVPASWPNEACRDYFSAKGQWFREYLQEKGGADRDCLKSMAVHLDETTPHCTYAFVPEKDGRLQAKNILTKSFLRDLQKDGYDFTTKWVKEHGMSLEELKPYKVGSERRHLTEVEYKEERVQAREKALEIEERAIAELQQAPDFKEYRETITENRRLKEELSLKDRLIERLQAERNRLFDAAEKLRLQLSDITRQAGSKLMALMGYGQDMDRSLNPYPEKHVSAGIREMMGGVELKDARQYRVIPDPEETGKFRVAYREKSGDYKTVKGGFETREEASLFRNNITDASQEMNRTREEERKYQFYIKN